MFNRRLNNDEPIDSPGVSQILTDTTTGEDTNRQGQAWLRAHDNTSQPRFSVWSMGADAAVWLAGAALFARSVLLLQRMIVIGALAELVAVVALAVACTLIIYGVSRTSRNERLYRLSLFALGVVIAIL